MPQLDKLSFATQYFWLTLFFFVLYFLTVNFFIITVFKNLKLRNIIYKIWYFFLYHFDYVEYYNQNKKLNITSFNTIFFNLYGNLILSLKSISIFNNIELSLNKCLVLENFLNVINKNKINTFFNPTGIMVKIQKLNSLKLDEI